MMSVQNNHRRNDLCVEVVRDLADFMKVVAIRSSVFLAEQDCPYDEEFDNNDLSALHLIAYLRGEPVATLRFKRSRKGSPTEPSFWTSAKRDRKSTRLNSSH